jgi:hypothetical protein
MINKTFAKVQHWSKQVDPRYDTSTKISSPLRLEGKQNKGTIIKGFVI